MQTGGKHGHSFEPAIAGVTLDTLKLVLYTQQQTVHPFHIHRINAHRVEKTCSLVIPQVAAGEVEIQGGIYDLETGRVEFLGESPNQASLITSGAAMPPSIA